MEKSKELRLSFSKAKETNPNNLVVDINGEPIGSIYIKQFPNKPGVHSWVCRDINDCVAIVPSEKEAFEWFVLQFQRGAFEMGQ